MPNEAESRVLARRTLQTTAPLFVAGPLIALVGLRIGSRIDNDLVFYGLPVLGITLMIAAVVLAKRATDHFSK